MATIAMWICIILAFGLGIPLLEADMELLGTLCLGGFALLGLFLESKLTTPEEKRAEEDYKKEQEFKKMNCGYKCPNCGAKAGHKISAISKSFSISTFGIASSKIGKTYKCEKCGYLW
ncbi:MAG: hypothetical protein E7419_01540 [Ruminococcaceae bacterium]|nr:hypothetical protein [Oscillospiraceae bacterium]